MSGLRAATEAAQNEEILQDLAKQGPDNSQGGGIYYGDTVQLLHLNSGLFLTMHKTPAPQNPNYRRVSLKPGSNAAQFRILPRSKVGARVALTTQVWTQF